MLKLRIATAAVLIPLALVALFYTTPNQFEWGLLGLSLIVGWEWSGFMRLSSFPLRLGYAFTIPVAVYIGLNLLPPVVSLSVSAIWWITAAVLVTSFPKSSSLLEAKWAMGLMGVVLTEPMMVAMVELKSLENGSMWLLYGLSVVWVADTGAYFAGRRWGRRKLAAAVSPGKTVEGFLGALAAVAVYSVVVSLISAVAFPTLLKLVAVSLVLVPISILGDLTESVFKRVSGLKDSGNILPGHGGVLDRIDSLASALPFFAAIFIFGYL